MLGVRRTCTSLSPVSRVLVERRFFGGGSKFHVKRNNRVARFVVDFERNNPRLQTTLEEDDEFADKAYKDILQRYKIPPQHQALLNNEPKKEKGKGEEEELKLDWSIFKTKKVQYVPASTPRTFQHGFINKDNNNINNNNNTQPNQEQQNEKKFKDPYYHKRKRTVATSKKYNPENQLKNDTETAHNNNRTDRPFATSTKTQSNENIKNKTNKSNTTKSAEENMVDEEVEEYFQHNKEDLFDDFWKQREQYGNFDPTKHKSTATKEGDKAQKSKDEEKEKEIEKKKKKRDPTPEEVDQNARKYIKQFMLKIHPDFFHQDTERREKNLQALQHLNSFLDTIRQLRDATKNVSKDKLPLSFTLTFYVKDADQPIATTFHLPKLPTEDAIPETYKKLLRQRAYEGVADLIVKAKIKIEEEDRWVTDAKQEQENRDFANSRLPKHWRPIGWSPKDENYSLIEIVLEHCRFIDVSMEQRESPFTRHQEEKIAMFVKDFFYFDSLAPEESNKAIEAFKESIHVLNFDQWARIPVVFSTRKGCERLRLTMENEGFIVLPYDFELDEVNEYLKLKLPGIKQRREAMVEKARQDMLQVEEMKKLVKLALNPKDIVIEESLDRENRRAALARSMIRASRAADIEMGHEFNSILQNDYKQLDFQREQDRSWYDRREGKFEPPTLEKVNILPLKEPPPFQLPPQLKMFAQETLLLESKDKETSEHDPNGLAVRNVVQLHVPPRMETPINADEVVSGPKLAFAKEASDNPAMRHGYAGLLMDDEEEDLVAKHETPTIHATNNSDNSSKNAGLQKFAGLANFEQNPTDLVSGEFFHGSSAVHCMQQLITLSTTEMKTKFPWHAIKIVISDHYHLDMANGEPTLYVPCYFDLETLKKLMQAEGGSALMKIHMEAYEHEFLQKLSDKVRDELGVNSVRISSALKESIDAQCLGLKKLEACADLFAHLEPSSREDVRVVLADTYALAQDRGYPKLYIPFDFDAGELEAYLENGAVPERYLELSRKREAEEGGELSEGDWENLPAFDEGDFAYDDEGNPIGEEGGHPV